jgi:hypothetical protein
LYPIYSVDLSDQPQKIFDIKSNISLRVEFNKPVPAPSKTDEGAVCYIMVISKSFLLYEPIKDKITDKVNKVVLFLFFIELPP